MLPSKSIVSSDVEKRLVELQRNMVGMKLESRTRDNLYYDLSVALNIAFVLLKELQELTKPKLDVEIDPRGTLAEALANGRVTLAEALNAEDVEFTDISTGDSLTYDEPESKSDPKKIEAAKKAAETRKVRSSIFENNKIVINPYLLSRLESKIPAIMNRSPLGFKIIRDRLIAQIAAAQILDKISGEKFQYHTDYLLDTFNKLLHPELYVMEGPFKKRQIYCLFNHRRDLSRISFNDNDIGEDSNDIVVLVTGSCGKDKCACDKDKFESVTFYPRGWLTVKEVKEQSNENTIISKDIKVSDFEKNSFEDLLI